MDYQLISLIACIIWSVFAFSSSSESQKHTFMIISNMFGIMTLAIGYIESIK